VLRVLREPLRRHERVFSTPPWDSVGPSSVLVLRLVREDDKEEEGPKHVPANDLEILGLKVVATTEKEEEDEPLLCFCSFSVRSSAIRAPKASERTHKSKKTGLASSPLKASTNSSKVVCSHKSNHVLETETGLQLSSIYLEFKFFRWIKTMICLE